MSNNLGSISAASINQSAQLSLDEASSTARSYLSAIAKSEDFGTKVAIAFGDSFDAAKAEELRQEWLAGDFDSLPAIEIRSAAEINGANGAFSADTNTIYLSKEYIAQNGSDVSAIADVLLEEIGHFIDSKINIVDSAGDEGAIFSALMLEKPLGEAELESLRSENDSAYITLDGQVIAIEQAAPPSGTNQALQYTEGLLSSIPARWPSNTITYNFMPSLPASYHVAIQATALLIPYAGAYIGSLASILAPEYFEPFSNAQKTATQKALGLWSEIANINFVLKEDTALRLADLLDVGIYENALKKLGLWDDFTEGLDRHIGSRFGFPITDGADIRFGNFSNSLNDGGGLSIAPLVRPIVQLERLRQTIADFIDTFAGNNFLDLVSGSEALKIFNAKTNIMGDVWINSATSAYQTTPIEEGSYAFGTLIHEIGHALGLKHPTDEDSFLGKGTGLTPGPFLPDGRNDVRYSIMSYIYTDDFKDKSGERVEPSTPMLYDISAIQEVYGARTSTRNNNTTYFGNGGVYSSLTNKPFALTIWDGGGIDTIDASTQATNSTINLNDGEFSSIGPLFLKEEIGAVRSIRNVAIAFGVTIENAIGGSGNDILFSNNVSNLLKGGGGIDKVSYFYSTAGVDVSLATNRAFGGYAQGDQLQEIESLEGSKYDDILIGNYLPNEIVGLQGNDRLTGGDSPDILDGGEGIDSASYSTSREKVQVDLRIGKGFGGEAEGDVLISIENVDGSDFDDELIGNDQANILDGRGGNDTLSGGAGKDTLIGGAGFDFASYASSTGGITLNLSTGEISGGDADGDVLIEIEGIGGSNFNDTLIGDSNDNTLSGLGGDDVLLGAGGNDQLNGGLGNDTLVGDVGNDTLRGSYDEDLLLGDAGDDILEGGQGNDQLYGGLNNDTLSGNEGNDLLFGEDGDDLLKGDTGNDELAGGTGNDQLYGGLGNDTLSGNEGNDQLFGEDGDDILKGDAGNDELAGGAGADNLNGNAGNDTLYGEAGNDFLMGEAGDDLIDGGTEVDTVSYDNSPSGVIVNIDEQQYYKNLGGSLHTTIVSTSLIPTDTEPDFTINAGTAKDGFGTTDTLRNLENIIGSKYDDLLIGNSKDNRIEALAGDDLLIGNAGNDYLDGGDGSDTVSYRRDLNQAQVKVNLEQNKATDGFGNNDQLYNIENVIGSFFDDEIIGDAKANIIHAGEGNDIIQARDGNDLIFGEQGQDTLFGENGDDFLVGGKDADTLNGGAGNDTASYFTSTTAVAVSLTTGTGWSGDADGDRLEAIENLEGSEFEDLLIGNQVNNIISGLGGNDLIYGEAGDDTLDGGTGSDRIYGGEGNDKLYGQAGEDLLKGEAGNDQLNGGDGSDQLYGQVGDDLLEGGTGNDSLYGGTGLDTLLGQAGDDYLDGGVGNDQLNGGDGNDRLYGQQDEDKLAGGTGDDYLDGGTGNDQLNGDDGNDRLYGQQGYDTLNGGAGSDFLDGGEGDDWLYGNDGSDRLYGQTGNDYLDGGTGDDRLEGGDGDDQLFGQQGRDYLDGGTGDDFLWGGDDADKLLGQAGNDNLYGELGNDELLGGDGNDRLYGGEGSDTLTGGAGNDYLEGGQDNDQLIGSDGNDFLYGQDGSDSLDGGIGNDNLYGGLGDDQLTGGDGNDLLYGQDGNDTLNSGTGDDYFDGGLGNDQLLAGLGNDQLYGGDGNDILDAGADNDYLDGGLGDDQLTGGDGDDQLSGQDGNDTLDAGNGNDNLRGGDGADILLGQDGDDYLFGDNGDDLLYGGAGNNYLEGGVGNDKLYAGDGDNILYGGLGQDTLYGGNGRDLFMVANGSGGDTIFNFVAGIDYLGLINGLTLEQLTITQGSDTNASNTLIANQQSGELLVTLVGVEASTLNMWDFSVL